MKSVPLHRYMCCCQLDAFDVNKALSTITHPDEPPGLNLCSNGWVVVPYTGFDVSNAILPWGRFVLQKGMAPADSRIRTTRADLVADSFTNRENPSVASGFLKTISISLDHGAAVLKSYLYPRHQSVPLRTLELRAEHLARSLCVQTRRRVHELDG
jgi:hypothetical protein